MAIGSVSVPPIPPASPAKPHEGLRGNEQQEPKPVDVKETVKTQDRDTQGTKKSSNKLVDLIA